MWIRDILDEFQHEHPCIYISVLGVIALLVSVPVGIVVLRPKRSLLDIYQDPVFWILFAWGLVWIIFGSWIIIRNQDEVDEGS